MYRYNCRSFQNGLVLYPDAPAPVSDSVNIAISCVPNAVISGSAQVTCHSNGTWGPENPVCECRLGYEDRETECYSKSTSASVVLFWAIYSKCDKELIGECSIVWCVCYI